MTKKIEKKLEKNSKNIAESNDVIRVESNIEKYNQQMQKFDKFIDTLEGISSEAFEFGKSYLAEKAKSEKRQQENEDKQHRRAIYTLVFLVAVVFVLCMTALVLKESEIVKLVFQSSLAIAAGAGVIGIWKYSSKKKDSND